MKKILALLMAGAMAFSLAACGSSDSSASSDGTADTGSAAAETAELDLDDIYELYVTWPSLGGSPEDLEEVEEAVNEITEAEIGVHVTLQPVALSDITSQQQLTISSGDKSDVICMLWTGLSTWVNTESVLELEDLLETYSSGIVDVLGDAAYGCTYGDHVYGITTQAGGYSYGFVCRTDMLEKYGFETEDRTITLEELEEIFATVKAGEGDSYYCVASGGSFQCINGRYDAVDGNMYSGAVMLDGDTTEVVNLYATDEFEEYANLMYEWAQLGYISADAATTDDSVQTLIATGNYLGAFTTTGASVKTSYSSGGTVDLTALTLQEGYTTSTDLQTVMFGIASTCENPEKAMAFLNELYTNESLARLLSLGIEGEHYVVSDENENGILVTYPDGVDNSSSGYVVSLDVWALGANSAWLPNDFDALLENEEKLEFEFSPLYGFNFDSTEYSTELTALSALYQEYYKIIDTGAIDPATELTAYIADLEAAGINDVIAACQKQYDAWLAEN